MSLTEPAPALTWLALGIAALALVLAGWAAARASRANGAAAAQRARPGTGAEIAPDELPQAVAGLQAQSATSLRRVAILRYDAFDDVAGRQSFTAALLDDQGDGLVLTSLANRRETRLFVKAVQSLTAPGLTPEEHQAIEHAMRGAQS